ncbi:dTDP-4-dehydrorhamnose reductase family protein [Ectobacillus antri]|uniref:dTDP-4-dehydrorhamnose reductase family protein n=1 Tax=Ectobacillus antri TaxID=2486280 RepID=UPI000F595052|nr:SDR family oxidoreductase [Ectobacillus antri]
MRLLILGGNGMAGHVITSYFQAKPQYEVFYTSRDHNGIFLDATDFQALESIIDQLKPDIVINCIGILNEAASTNPTLAFQVNSLLPHQLAKLTERYGGRVIQISTDCVFSGIKGDYTEQDLPDGTSVYAQSKQLGELVNAPHVTIRTSIIGPERKANGIGLFLWFMKQTGTIKGYQKVLWNGITTLELAKVTEHVITSHTTGMLHVCAPYKITKHDLLHLFQSVFHKHDVSIVPDNTITLDRTIVNTRSDFSYTVPGYQDMLAELREWMENHA